MKSVLGWYWPDHEKHLIEWMSDKANRFELNGRASYQGRKQVAAISEATKLRGQPLRTAVDVGGHVGLWSFNLAAAFQEVHAFEPVDMMRECFAANVTSPRVHLHPFALGAERLHVTMHTTKDSTGDSWVAGVGQIEMRTLDSFELTDVDLIKVDCEGYEEHVIRGALKTIGLCKPVVIVEQKRDMARKFGLEPQGAVRLLQRKGYAVKADLGGDFLMVPN